MQQIKHTDKRLQLPAPDVWLPWIQSDTWLPKASTEHTFAAEMRQIVQMIFLSVIGLSILSLWNCTSPETGRSPVAASNHEIAGSLVQIVSAIDSAPQETRHIYSKEDLLGKFKPESHPEFALIAPTHSIKSSIYLRKPCYDAFREMFEAAKKDGIPLRIISATRNFDYQKAIWEKKWKRPKYEGWKDLEKVKDILRYSSMPGTSRHHWGTDIDINSVDPAYFEHGEGERVYNWLVNQAHTFGFYQTYTSKSLGRTGYEEEKWHWSYFPLAVPMLEQYNQTISYDDLKGFSGAISARESGVIEQYVNGIAKP